MSLPPEQINIKRRREEEPVETLYIQSELHQTKRRFTDFVFQRVLAGGDGTSPSKSAGPSPAPTSAAQRPIRTPRSVSSLNFPSPRKAPAESGVPSVRATSPGAEFREQKRLQAARKETEEKFSKAFNSSPVWPESRIGLSPEIDATSGRSSALSAQESATPPSVRKFQISRSSTPASLRKNTGGVQKRKGDSVSGVAVLVEKLTQPHSRKASMVTDLLASGSPVPVDRSRSSLAPEEPVRPRKRPVVNKAEKQWREERQNAISTAKERIARMTETGGDSDDESERLAKQFEQVALDLEPGMDTTPEEDVPPPPTKPTVSKPTLKYQPRLPNKPRVNATMRAESSGTGTGDTMQLDHGHPTSQTSYTSEEKDDGDGEYVYDTYIRRPIAPSGQLSNPLANLETNHDTWLRDHGIDMSRPDIGIIVISPDDEQYWDNFAEDDEDEDQWDSEDADSNAENNPANDYPDEELSWDDEDDDPTAIYTKYRGRAASDDEEFDIYDSASEGEDRFEY